MKVVKNTCYGAFNLSNAALNRLSELTGDSVEACKEKFVYTFDIAVRSNPVLVQVVEELGEEAETSGSLLQVVEVPNGTKCHIEDYDGMERVVEDHRVW